MPQAALPRVVVAGDSTAAPYLAPAYPMCGWAAHLGAPLTAQFITGALDRTTGPSGPSGTRGPTTPADPSGTRVPTGPIHVVDLAKNGASTSSYIAEGLWAAVLSATAPGDVVVLQFGHNDQKDPDLDPWGGFTRTLAGMVCEVRAADAHPVLATPVARRHFAHAALEHTHGEYPAAVTALAADLEVPLMDLNAHTRALLEEQGEEPSRRLFTQLPPGASPLYPDGIEDNTHFSVTGAIHIAEIVAELLAPILRRTMCAGAAHHAASGEPHRTASAAAHSELSDGPNREVSGSAHTGPGGTRHTPVS